MTRESFIIAGVFMVMLLLITMIFFTVFGQITMRKLRKNPETKAALGMEFVSGWNILNVALTLSIPRRIVEKASNGPMAFFFPDVSLLYKYTTRTDRLLARLLGYFAMTVTIAALGLLIVEKLGVVAAS